MIHVIVPTCLEDQGMVLACLRSMNAEEWGSVTPFHRIYLVVNNDRIDVTLETRQLLAEDAHVLWQQRKIGFVDACNLGYRAAEPAPDDVVIVLNDDLVFRGPWMHVLVGALEDGASQVGPSMKYVGRDAMWGRGDEKYRYLEGWCFATTGAVVRQAARLIGPEGSGEVCPRKPVLFDPAFAPAYCEDMDFSIRVQESGGTLARVDVPIEHLRSQTYGNNRPSWAHNRQKLIEKWDLG